MSMYTWALDGMFKADANKVGREIDKLRGKDGGVETKTVVEWARKHPRSALHKCFNWDVDKAAQHYWEHTAGKILRTLRIVTKSRGKSKTHRVNVSVRRNSGSPGYHRIEDVANDPAMVAEVANQALRGLQGWISRYEELMASFPQTSKALHRAVKTFEKEIEAVDIPQAAE